MRIQAVSELCPSALGNLMETCAQDNQQTVWLQLTSVVGAGVGNNMGDDEAFPYNARAPRSSIARIM